MGVFAFICINIYNSESNIHHQTILSQILFVSWGPPQNEQVGASPRSGEDKV